MTQTPTRSKAAKRRLSQKQVETQAKGLIELQKKIEKIPGQQLLGMFLEVSHRGKRDLQTKMFEDELLFRLQKSDPVPDETLVRTAHKK